jgi:hypothetical protein
MKRLSTDRANVFTFDGLATPTDALKVFATVAGENGAPLKTDTGVELSNISNDATGPGSKLLISYNGTTKKYTVAFNLDPATKPQYGRIFWYATASGVPVDLTADFQPEDCEIAPSYKTIQATGQIMPVQVFLDRFIAADAKMDAKYKAAVNAFVAASRSYMAQELFAAQGDLEREIKMKFFPTPAHMERDFFQQEFRSEFWLQQVDYKPIISVDHYFVKYGATGVEITEDIADKMLIEPKMGTIEFLPTTVSGSLFAALLTNVSALGLSIMADGGYSRVPCLFRIDYTHGLDFPNLSNQERESIRNAVGRRALINVLPKIDPLVRATSESKSIDGASKSKTGGIKDYLKEYKTEDAAWCASMQREYGSGFEIAVV